MLLPTPNDHAGVMVCGITTGVIDAGCATPTERLSLIAMGGQYLINSVASKNKLLLSLGVNN